MRLPAIAASVLFASAGAALAAPAPASAPRDDKVWAAAEQARPAQLKFLETLVNIDSGTGDVEGGRKVAALLKPRLEALGMSVELVAAEVPGLPENVVARLAGTGKGRILLIGHLDTVFEPGTAARRPYRTDAAKAYGPGVGDEKGGVVEAVHALEILKAQGFTDFKSITFLIESSEERGSPGTRALIGKLLADADVELNLEPGEEPDGITVWRKGSNSFEIHVKGRAAHAGVAPQEGRNAAEELIHQLDGLKGLPKTGDGMTVNLTLMSAGSRNNIIPEDAQATLNVRVREPKQGDAVAAVLAANAKTTLIPDTVVSIQREITFPPLPVNAATNALATRAQAIYAGLGLGLTLSTGGNGGASESALANEAGVAALDGLGPSGGGYHSEKEYINLSHVTPRLYLLTKLIMALGRDPPARLR